MSLDQRAIAYFDSGGTTFPRGTPLSAEDQFSSESAYWAVNSQFPGSSCQQTRFLLVSSGTLPGVVSPSAEKIMSRVPYLPIGYWSGAIAGQFDVIFDATTGRDYINCGGQITNAGLLNEAVLSDDVAAVYNPAVLRAGSFIPRLTILGGGTARIERRRRDTETAITQRAQQREKNKPAVELLEKWLNEEVNADAGSGSLKKIIAALNADRLHSRKLFP